MREIVSPLSGIRSPFGTAGRPSWLPAGAIWGYRGTDYWRNGNTSLSNLMAESRSGTALALMADGSYQSFAANTPIIRPTLGLDGYGSYTQYFLNEAAPVNQTITLPATGSYTLHVQGAGSAAVAAGTATISNAGSADASAPRTIGCSATGTVNVTITGSPTRVWFTNTAFPVPPVTTAGSPVTRAASNLTVVDPTSLGITKPRYIADVNIDRLSSSAARTLYAAGVDANENIAVFLDTDNRVKARLRKLGAELVSNPGGPFVDTTGWTEQQGTMSVVGGKLRATRAGGTHGRATTPITCVVGRPYRVNVSGIAATTTGAIVIANSTLGTAAAPLSMTSNGAYTFIATQTTHYVMVFASSGADGTYVECGAVSVREVVTHYTLQSGVIGSTGTRRVEVNFSPGANSLTVEGVTGDSNTDATALPTLTTWRLLNGLGGTTPWNGNVPMMALGEAA